ncbi:uncharacterized protein LOC141648366 [Silene latifolia]|uniref:uncharacterized protein LOC141648366 n=1 Tax=Silene latifolia TaxID=37657 RepID=UPI003D777AE1
MNRINGICRNFLWGGKDSYYRAPAVSWDRCCIPKKEGGLGIKDPKTWNKALFGKYVWWIASKKDHLWVKWINHVYMKGTHWTSYSPPHDCSWSWKKIAHTMETFKAAYVSDNWLGTSANYTPKEGYIWLRPSPPQVRWWKICWNTLNIPKSAFIFWAASLGRLLTRDRMLRMGFSQGVNCYICDEVLEDHPHLFYKCHFSNCCIQLLHQQLDIRLDPTDLVNWYNRGRKYSLLIRKVVVACHVMLTYLIWHTRNKARVHHQVPYPTLKRDSQQVTIVRVVIECLKFLEDQGNKIAFITVNVNLKLSRVFF